MERNSLLLLGEAKNFRFIYYDEDTFKNIEEIASHILSKSIDEDLKKNWLIRCICNHHNTSSSVFKLTNINNQANFVLKVDFSAVSKLSKEVNFFFLNNQLPYFPKIYSYGKLHPTGFYYVMEYFHNFISYERIYKENKLTKQHLDKLFDVLKHLERINHKSDYIQVKTVYQAVYLNRLFQRLELLKTSFLNEILSYRHLELNGNRMKNVIIFWEELFPRLQEPFFLKLHNLPGDAHFENVLVNSIGEMKIIDPKGELYLPIIYDLGKLLHSLHGGYNTFTSLDFYIKHFHKNCFDFYYEFPNSRNELLQYAETNIQNLWGTKTLKAAYLSELFHFSSLIAHHIAVKKEALGLYCRTVELINEYQRRFI